MLHTASWVCHAVLLSKKIVEVLQVDATLIHVDNKLIALEKNHVFHNNCSKHIETRFHFTRDCCISWNEVQIEYVKTQDQIVIIFSKPLKVDMFNDIKTLFEVFRKNV